LAGQTDKWQAVELYVGMSVSVLFVECITKNLETDMPTLPVPQLAIMHLTCNDTAHKPFTSV